MNTELKVSEIRNKSTSELIAREAELKEMIFTLRSASVGNDEKKQSHLKRKSRKELARILTVKRERELTDDLREMLL